MVIYQAMQRQLIWPKKSDVLHSGQLFSNLLFHIPSEDFFYLKRYISLLVFTFNLAYLCTSAKVALQTFVNGLLSDPRFPGIVNVFGHLGSIMAATAVLFIIFYLQLYIDS